MGVCGWKVELENVGNNPIQPQSSTPDLGFKYILPPVTNRYFGGPANTCLEASFPVTLAWASIFLRKFDGADVRGEKGLRVVFGLLLDRGLLRADGCPSPLTPIKKKAK